MRDFQLARPNVTVSDLEDCERIAEGKAASMLDTATVVKGVEYRWRRRISQDWTGPG
jgi:hypothetical protein